MRILFSPRSLGHLFNQRLGFGYFILVGALDNQNINIMYAKCVNRVDIRGVFFLQI